MKDVCRRFLTLSSFTSVAALQVLQTRHNT